MNIRSAIESDIPSILELAKIMHDESRFRIFNYNKEKMEVLITNLITNDCGILILAEENKLLGGIMGIVAEHYFGHDKSASDLGLFVNPDNRNSKIGIRLIKEYINKAKEKGAVDILIRNTTGYKFEYVGKLYKAMGFNKIGGNYCLGALNV